MTRTTIRLSSLEERLAPSVSLVADINRTPLGMDFYNPMVTANDTVLFRSRLGEVWRSDGTPAGTGPAGFHIDAYGSGVEFAGAHFFTGRDPAHGDEVWRTDGTPEGTWLVKDTLAGSASGAPRNFVVAGNTLYFVANGNQLWRSDGTSPGTFPIRSIGVNDTFAEFDPGIRDLVAAGDRLYIQVRAPVDSVLWTSDGTYVGTRPLIDASGAGYSVSYLFGGVNGSFYFSAGSRLWVSDGTAGGTKQLRDDLSVSFEPYMRGWAAFDGRFYFLASDATSGAELWETDGTADGTKLVKDINSTGSSGPRDFIVQGSYLYFRADDGTTGYELWRTDGTADGTIRLGDLVSGAGSPDIKNLTSTTGGLYFTAVTPATGKELWKSDGTPEGTVLVADLEPGPRTSFPTWLVSTGDRVFWVANTPTDGSALWTAGQGAGATFLSQIPATTEDAYFGSNGVTIGGIRYSVANDRVSGWEIWRTDGTAAGTWMLKDIIPGPDDDFPAGLTAVDGTLYFDAGPGLWASDGTPDGTRLVKNIWAGNPTAFQGKLIFTANAAGAGQELWVSDGTTDGTRLVKDIYPGGIGAFASNSPKFTELNGYLYFAANDPDHGLQLWRTDGTDVGTTLVTDLPAPWVGLTNFGQWGLERVGDRLVFWGEGGTGKALWSTDGTAGGTAELLGGLAPEPTVFGFQVVGDRLLFWLKDAAHGTGLWVTDGTPAGTSLVRSALPSGYLYAAGGLAYFTDLSTEKQLWRTDGTPAGTFLLRTFTQPVAGLTTLADQMHFLGHDPANGYGLWTTDGTVAGTRPIKITGTARPRFQSIFELGGSLYMNVAIPTGGFDTFDYTLWRSDGTEAGTQPIAPGKFSPVTDLNGVPLFTHDDGVSGIEFWRYDPITTAGDHYTLENGLRLDVPAAAGLLANDADGGGDSLTAVLVTRPKKGWVTLRPDGSFFYQPFNPDFSGSDSFTYRASAGGEKSLPVAVSIDVDLVNQAPIAKNDTVAGRAGNAVTVRVLANDADPDNDALSVSSFTQAAYGRVSKVGNALVYTPRVARAQTDTFTYTVRDQRGETATATVTVNLTAAPPPKVTAVRLFPGPGYGSINLMALGGRTLPFQRFYGIEVTFSANVSVAADDLRLIGADGGSYNLHGFTYDAARRTATWVIDGPAIETWADRLTVLIDGTAATGVTGATGIGLGDWARTISVLVGDFDGNGIVTAADRNAVRNQFGTVVGLRRLFADVDGNGVVDAAELDLVNANLGGRRV